MKSLLLKLIFTLLLIPFIANSQITKPSLSPLVTTIQKVGLAKIKLEYGQPNKQSRKIFGALIPFNRVWRTGANSSTKITIDRAIKMNGIDIPSGKYGLYTIPNKKEWTIIIHKNSSLWGDAGYSKKEELTRFKIPVTPLKDTLETLSIRFDSFHANGANLIIAWENTKISIPVFIDSDTEIFKEIEAKITNSTKPVKAHTYFEAAQFYYHKNTKLKVAESWFDQAIKLSPNSFWYVYYRAELAYTLKEYEVAKNYTLTCLEAAKKSKSSDYGYIAKCNLLLQKIKTKS